MENNLQNINKPLTLDSREVAKMINIRHSDLLEKIKCYCEILTNGKFRSLEFFIRSNYIDSKNETRPCFLITKKGCDMIANKLTGQKGVIFTATYVNKFYAMEQVLQQPQQDSYMIENPIKRAERWIQEQKERQNLELENKQKEQVIGELKPKADYVDKILKSTDLVTITQIAKDYGYSGKKMNKVLHNLGVQFKQSGQWLLYTEIHDKGYTNSETVKIIHSDGRPGVKMNTKWTQKGRLFLYGLLKEHGILPVIERAEEDAS